jgi:excisionase family DNA binding protein
VTDARSDRKPMQLSLFFRPTRNAAWVAQYLKTSAQTVARLIEAGKLDAYRLTDRGPWYVYLDSVDDYLRNRAAKYGQEHRLPPSSDSASGGSK